MNTRRFTIPRSLSVAAFSALVLTNFAVYAADAPTLPGAPAPMAPTLADSTAINNGLKKLLEQTDPSISGILAKYPDYWMVQTNSAVIPAPQGPGMDANFVPKHEAAVARAKQGGIDLLFVGDSIMQGWPSSGDWGKETYEKYYTSQYRVADFAIGYDRTQHVLWRMQNGEGVGYQPKVIDLLIGTNNLGQNTVPETIDGEVAVLTDLRQRFPAAKILVLGIFPRGTPTDPVRQSVATVNAALAKMADNKNIFYLDIGKIFLNDDGTVNSNLKSDRLHPSAAGYAAWADAQKEMLDKLLDDSGVTPSPQAAAPAA